jgi:acyl-CoA synthetase (AMP-forming)/AMP-acid ligase II
MPLSRGPSIPALGQGAAGHLPTGVPQTLPDALRRQATERPVGRALVARSVTGATARLTWAELDRLTDRIACGLVRLGVRHGDRVALLARNTAAAEAVVMFYAVHKAGAVNVPINARFVASEIHGLLEHCGARVLVAEADLLDAVVDQLRDLSELEHFVCIGPAGPADAVPWSDLSEGDAASIDQLPAVVGADQADWLFTSGTTGKPKCVMTTHAGCVATGVIMRSAFGLVGGDVLHTPFPFYTSSGCHSSALSALLAGATYVVDPEVDVAAVLQRAQDERSTVFGSVPAVLTYMLESGLLHDVDLSAMRVVFSGGAALPAVLAERVIAAFPGAAVTNFYGLTEAGNIGLNLAGHYARVKPGSIGREPMPWTRYKVVDSSGREVKPGEVGEILLTGPSIMAGYYADEEATAATIQDGWLRTGDLVRLDTDGFVYVHDRMKDVIIRGGFNISSLEVENVLVAHPNVLEAAVVGKPHPRLGEDVCAFIVPCGEGLDTQAVADFCATRLADFKVPREFVVLNDLPRNATGKVLKAKLRLQAGGAAS